MESKIFDVCIIGAGWSGLIACKYMKQFGLSVVVLEKNDYPGGIWKYHKTGQCAITKNTHTSSSKTFTELSDFPIPDEYPSFISHQQMMTYIRDYVKHFGLDDHIKYKTELGKLEKDKENNVWLMHSKDLESGEEYTIKSKNVISACGANQFPNDISTKPEFKNFSGKIVHSSMFRKVELEHLDKRILIVGLGETASDIAAELSHVSKHLFVSSGGAHLIRRYNQLVVPDFDVIDHYSSKLREFVSPPHLGSFGFREFIHFLWGQCGHNIKEWMNDAPFQRHFMNKSGEILLNQVAFKMITPKPRTLKAEGEYVYFADGSKEKIDYIILCNGYLNLIPYIPNNYKTKPENDFKLMFNNEDPSLVYVGRVRPVVGGLPPIYEVQSMYIARVLAGLVKLPEKEDRSNTIAEDLEWYQNYFQYTSRRLNGLVDFLLYVNTISKMGGFAPDYKKLFYKNPYKWWKAITAPYNNCRFLLNDDSKIDYVLDHYSKFEPKINHFRFIFIYTFGWLGILFYNRFMRLYYFITFHIRNILQMDVDSNKNYDLYYKEKRVKKVLKSMDMEHEQG